MKNYVYSENNDIKHRLVDILITDKQSAQGVLSLSELNRILGTDDSANLIFHLSGHDSAESELKHIQSKFSKKVNTLVLTNSPEPEQGIRLLNYNIRGYANTFIEPEKLLIALSVIKQGEIWVGAVLIQYMLTQSIKKSVDTNHNSLLMSLTDREQQIAQTILLGYQNKRIADELSITQRTVKAHLSAIFKKLQVRNRLELILKLQ